MQIILKGETARDVLPELLEYVDKARRALWRAEDTELSEDDAQYYLERIQRMLLRLQNQSEV